MKTAEIKFLLFTILFITSISIIGWNGSFDQVNDTTRQVQTKEPFDISLDDSSLTTHRSNLDYSDFINPDLPYRDSNNYPLLPDFVSLGEPMLSMKSVQYEPHPVISIIGNDDFNRQNFTGNGTLSNPYLIQDLEITANHTHLISIQDTTVHFVIKQNFLDGITGLFNGINLVNVINGDINNNIIGFTSYGIRLYNSDENLIYENEVHNNTLNGIYLINSENNFIGENVVYTNEHGISLTSSWSNDIDSNFVSDNRHQGIAIYNSSFLFVHNNTATNNGWNGIIETNSFNNTIMANFASFNGYDGIYSYSCNNSNFIINNIVNNSGNGLFLQNVNGSTFNDNLIAGNLANGIFLKNSNFNQILFNVIMQNGANGITIINSNFNYIHDNEIFENYGSTIDFPIRFSQFSVENIEDSIIIGQIDYSVTGTTSGHGIFLDPSTGNRIEFNDIYNNFGSGAYLLEADSTEFNHNIVTENGENGIFLENSSFNTLFKNIIIGNGYTLFGAGITSSKLKLSIQGTTSGHGIFLDPSHNNIISENEISHNYANGISLFESSDSIIVGNTITKNSNGIYLEDSNYNNLSHNTVSKNGDLPLDGSLNSDIRFSISGTTSGHGIFLDPSDYNVIEHNTVFGNAGHGVFLMDSDYTNILKNSISVNGFYGVFVDLNSDESTVNQNDFNHNNFGEGSQANDDGSRNLFDENYWSDLTGDSYKIDGLAGNEDLHPSDVPYFPPAYDYSFPELLFPNGGETLSGLVTIQFYRATMEFNLPDEISYWLFYSSDAGVQWIGIPMTSFSITLASDGQKIINVNWNTEAVLDGSNYLVQVVAVDKTGSVLSDSSDNVFQIKNGLETTDEITTTTTPSLTPSWTIIGSLFSICSYGVLSIRKRKRNK